MSETDNTKAVDSSRPASDENKPHEDKCGPDDGSPERKEEIHVGADVPLFGGRSTRPLEENPQDEKAASAE
jgi:hypothetical protein